jgi:hypothetical protein
MKFRDSLSKDCLHCKIGYSADYTTDGSLLTNSFFRIGMVNIAMGLFSCGYSKGEAMELPFANGCS